MPVKMDEKMNRFSCLGLDKNTCLAAPFFLGFSFKNDFGFGILDSCDGKSRQARGILGILVYPAEFEAV